MPWSFGLGQGILTSVDVSKPLNLRKSRIDIALYVGGERDMIFEEEDEWEEGEDEEWEEEEW
jgi:hypothetical protein